VRTVAGRDTGEVPNGSLGTHRTYRCTQPVRQRVDLAGSGYGLHEPHAGGRHCCTGQMQVSTTPRPSTPGRP